MKKRNTQRPAQTNKPWIVVIGTSAGGLDALKSLLPQFSKKLDAAFFVVQHLPATANAKVILDILKPLTPLFCKVASDGEEITAGRILIAAPDHHLLIKRNNVLVTKGAAENRYRPSIDSLFRSAAVAYSNRVIGIILTGRLDDGTAGLAAIKECGGISIVQSPDEATYPDMPGSAIENVKVDYSVRLDEMGPLLEKLMGRASRKPKRMAKEIVAEAAIAERVLSDVEGLQVLGEQVPYNCPACGGVLWQIANSKVHRYRCHTGHSFTAASLEESQLEKIEETLWISLRMLEERRNLLNTTAAREDTRGYAKIASLQRQRAKEIAVHIDRIRDILRSSTKTMSAGIPAKH